MSSLTHVLAATVLLWSLCSAAEFEFSGSDSDVTSLLQVDKIVADGESSEAAQVGESLTSLGRGKTQRFGTQSQKVAKAQKAKRLTETAARKQKKAHKKEKQYPPWGGSPTGSTLIADPQTAAAQAAQAEKMAERATEDTVWQAQQQERASMWASKKAGALRASAEMAAVAQSEAAVGQIAAADSLENDAIRRASTGRNHARDAAMKSMVTAATAHQAANEQTFAAQRAASSRAALQSATDGLRHMEDDTQSADFLFNDRDARRAVRHRYHNAMDEINFDRKRFRDEDEDEDYDMDEDEDYYGHRFPNAMNMAMMGVPA